MFQTFMKVFEIASWPMTAVMGLLFAAIFAELIWWYLEPSRRQQKDSKRKRDPKLLQRAAIAAILFAVLYGYYYSQLSQQRTRDHQVMSGAQSATAVHAQAK